MIINRQHAPQLPDVLRDPLAESWEMYVEASTGAGLKVPRNRDLTTSMMRVWAGSDFVMRACIDDPSLVNGFLDEGSLLADYAVGEYPQKLGHLLKGVRDQATLGRKLREFRQREMVRIAWRDLAGWAPLNEVLHDLTALADASVQAALDQLSQWALHSRGKQKKFSPALVILGMGKLGARELNFSSDIDLIFAYPDNGSGWNSRQYSLDEFYLGLGQQLINILDAKTEAGFVYRVDMRLRPYGDSGPLVASFDAMADYYQLQGREWERYAMIKARPVAGPAHDANTLMELLRPFVYRRYLDFGVFESLRQLKEQIVREVERKGMQDNIKLGPGGIREIEFIVQAFQLVRGGRDLPLQQRGVLDVLHALAALGYLPAVVTVQLADAYVFLRQTENRLQAFDDQQLHELPEDDTGRARLAFTMGFDSWEGFTEELNRHRMRVQEQFEQVFAGPQESVEQAQRSHDLGDVWRGDVEAGDAIAVLESAGYADANQVVRWLAQFRHGPVTRFLGERGRQRLDELMPMVLQAIAGTARPLEVLRRVGDLLEAVSGRTTYLTLLVENPMALSQLVELCAASAWVAGQLSQHPILLDELLDPRTLYNPLDRVALQGVLQVRMAGIAADDLEQQMDQLRRFQQAAALRVAAADIIAGLLLTRVGDHLTCIAETVLETTVQLAWQHLVARHGRPGYIMRGKVREAGMAIVGYGKLGGLELGYGSDLDIVFLHDSSGNEQHTAGPNVIDNSEFFTRLSQRIIHILNTFTSAGTLYEVDMRLRPNGNSGMLVSSMEAFAEYQRRSAWTWENQAMIRARVVVGGEAITRQFERIRSGVLARPREAPQLKAEVLEMRQRMRDELDRSGRDRVDLKHCSGGIVDIEFMVQFAVLLWSNTHPGLLRYTDNLRLLEMLAAEGLLPADEVGTLSAAYCTIRQRINHRVLQDESSVVDDSELADERRAVTTIWERFMGDG
ncbi:MAG: bifunctional [glutamate--ammonia ligase]-adenylyl-L-tyrosine phosphorylase/[glutamate--ammonia-ligase] adenylyltransferase [Gammaproteobacteria bacterium]